MRYLVTADEMQRYDQNCMQKIGIPSMVLMERAALETFYALREKGLVRKGESAFVLAGYGNNGGDGLALARMLSEAGMDVEVCLVGKKNRATEQWTAQNLILRRYPVREVERAGKDAYTVVIDALFGVGLSRPLEGDFVAAVDGANAIHGTKVALDLPSGIHASTGRILGTAFRADLTVTYGFEKRGLFLSPGRDYAGEVICADVGISKASFFGEEPSCFTLEESLEELLPRRSKDGNKGSFGKALIIAGSMNVAGAAILCARACYRLGAGMVKVLTCPENRIILQESVPEALLGSVEEESEIQKSLDWCDVICIGPGLGKTPYAIKAFEMVLKDQNGMGKPLVIDADGIHLLAEKKELQAEVKRQGEAGRTIVLTPHPGELGRLLNGLEDDGAGLSVAEIKQELASYGMTAAKALSSIMVAKNDRTFVCGKETPLYLNLSGNSGLGTAGSGDVLAGVITAFLCQGNGSKELYDSNFGMVCRAVRTHGLLGDRAARGTLGEHGIMAGDLTNQVF